MSQPRICDCKHSLAQHFPGDDGYARPCYECACTSFTDEQHRNVCSPRRRSSNTVWDKSETAVVFKKPDGTYAFPGRNDRPTPAGCERIEIRSDADMARVEREAGVRSERRWFDRGSGGEFDGDQTMRPIPKVQR